MCDVMCNISNQSFHTVLSIENPAVQLQAHASCQVPAEFAWLDGAHGRSLHAAAQW